ncbi:hypothetical protein FB451DRAFT_1378617 [Mycena latifolia]|nr:hypothetical protein FB451DRAFT_1378617 [Mycena latifolia]
MASQYSLLVQSVEGVPWKPGPLRNKYPNLYVAIHQDGMEIGRTRTIKRELSPTWDHLARISSNASASIISLRIFHDMTVLARDRCLGMVSIDTTTLARLCGSDGDAKVVKLELRGAAGEQKGRPSGSISVRLIKDTEAAASSVDQGQQVEDGMVLRSEPSADMNMGDGAAQSKDLSSTLASVISKLEIIVRIGDDIVMIHPYANIAWKVLTSVYRATKTQQETDDKLLKLVQTMVEAYSFVDVDTLLEKLKRHENEALGIVKQTAECALFIQAYTAHGFRARSIFTSSLHVEMIEDLCATLLEQIHSFHGRLAVQPLFLSTKLRTTLELAQPETLKRLNPVEMDAGLRTMCLPGTRREILDHITEWITVPSDSGSVLWLYGVAGSGKSTISTTVSEIFRQLGRLGAFFFFDRNNASLSRPGAVIRTIAYSLGLSDPRIGVAICNVIHRDPTIANAPIRAQFTELLLQPLVSVEMDLHGPILIIIDGLDGCGDPDSRAILLALLSDEFLKLPPVFRVLITSRPDPDIVSQIESRLANHLEVSASTEDVALFIRHEMALMQQRWSLDLTWPGEDKIQALTHLSEGRFSWASKTIRSLDSDHPDQQLEELLTQNNTGQATIQTAPNSARVDAGSHDTSAYVLEAQPSVLGTLVPEVLKFLHNLAGKAGIVVGQIINISGGVGGSGGSGHIGGNGGDGEGPQVEISPGGYFSTILGGVGGTGGSGHIGGSGGDGEGPDVKTMPGGYFSNISGGTGGPGGAGIDVGGTGGAGKGPIIRISP